MKTIVLLSLLASASPASTIIATGSGLIEKGNRSEHINRFSIGGTDGVNTFSFTSNCYSSSPGLLEESNLFRVNTLDGGYCYSNATVNDATSMFLSSTRSDDMWTLTLFDRTRETLAAINFTARIAWEDRIHPFEGYSDYRQSYDVVHAPEPATFALAGGALALLAWRRKSKALYTH